MILLLGQSRVLFAMSRDRLLPPGLATVHPKYGTPYKITLITGVVVAVLAGFIPLSTLAELVNIGTLFAFVLVSIGVIVLRRTRPDLQRSFRVPRVPVLPILSVLACFYLMLNLPGETWIRFGVWMVIGIVVYFGYGRSHSRFNTPGEPRGRRRRERGAARLTRLTPAGEMSAGSQPCRAERPVTRRADPYGDQRPRRPRHLRGAARPRAGARASPRRSRPLPAGSRLTVASAGLIGVLEAVGLLAAGAHQPGRPAVRPGAGRPAGSSPAGLLLLAGWIVLCAGSGAAVIDGAGRTLLVGVAYAELVAASRCSSSSRRRCRSPTPGDIPLPGPRPDGPGRAGRQAAARRRAVGPALGGRRAAHPRAPRRPGADPPPARHGHPRPHRPVARRPSPSSAPVPERRRPSTPPASVYSQH